jgi:hypothetical protein
VVGDEHANDSGMLVRILRQPTGHVDGISLADYHPGQTYDVQPLLADYLMVQGFATIEMRREQKSDGERKGRSQKPKSDVF